MSTKTDQNDSTFSEDSEFPTSTRPAVGVPIHEAVLVEILEKRAARILPAGAGRSVYVILEPELGHGRPDVILLNISSRALASFVSRGLRVPNLTAARALDPSTAAEHLGVSETYARSLRRSMADAGWRPNDLLAVSRMVHDAVAVEAKMSDWRRATRQVARFRRMVDRAAIMMPRAKASKISSETLEHYGVGVLSVTGSSVDWTVPSPVQLTSECNRIWLLELLLRGFEDGSAYRFSAARNRLNASAKAPTRLA